MEEKQYFLKLEEIDKKIDNNNFEEAQEELKEIYSIKPVRLEWFILKAKLVYKSTKNYNEIWQVLANKGWGLYNYHSVSKFIRLYSEINVSYNDYSDSYRNRINASLLECSKEEKIECEKIINKQIEILQENEEKFLQDINSGNIIEYLLEIQNSVFILENKLMYLIITYWLDYNNINNYGKYNYYHCHRNWILDLPNVGYLQEIIQSKDEETFILILDGNAKDYEVVAHLLKKFNKKVFLVNVPMDFEVDYNINLKDTVNISIENSENYYEDIILVNPIRLIKNGKVIGDNIDYIIDYICKECTKDDLSTVITSGKLFDELALRPLMKKRLERLSEFEADYREDNMAFGWAGNYLSYISKVYCFNVEEEIKKEPQYKFSIVIPARNSAYTLRYTLQTCLNQTYKGDYEIVVSDNSTNGNKDVYNLIKEINDSRIKYYKAPRNLHLPKSFEFAFLKAKGDFIFSIGSDDGIFPWTLEVIEKILNKYPDEDIIQWERGYYTWPGFNGGDENKFFIPRKYEKDNYKVHKVKKEEYLAKILKYPKTMFSLPMLYINSGFRKRYLNKLLDKTGRLWDGICQDIYIGVINAGINEEILNIQYPLAMVALSSNSIGNAANTVGKDIKDENDKVQEEQKTNNIGGFSMSSIERFVPQLGTDVSSLYNSLLRAVARGVFPEEYLTNLFDFKKIFMECYNSLHIMDIFLDKKIHYMRYIASKHGKEFLKWFDENIYNVIMNPILINENKVEEQFKRKKYEEGENELGGITLDASKYGVTNVCEAVKLFKKLTKF